MGKIKKIIWRTDIGKYQGKRFYLGQSPLCHNLSHDYSIILPEDGETNWQWCASAPYHEKHNADTLEAAKEAAQAHCEGRVRKLIESLFEADG